ncbi:MAG TPA: SWIM zinc finger family protein [Roseiarcus sp.]|nr:SWIM zinc finger family protein [Roseiarcus sp.]
MSLISPSKCRFDVEALKKRVGGTVFSRGEAYQRDGRVRMLSVEPARVLAEVEGTEDYRVEVTGRGAEIGGECACPAFEERGMCKHMVATALAANAAGDDDGEGRGPLAHIRDHLKAKSVEELVDMIVGLAEADPDLFRRLDLAATARSEDDETLKARFKAAIDQATRTGGYVDYKGARDWANRVDDALDAVADLSSGPRASLALELAEHAIERIEEASNEIDDSSGHCGDLIGRAVAIHGDAARTARLIPAPLARALFEREMTGDSDAFAGAVKAYADVLGDEGLAEYRRLADEAYAKLPALNAGGGEIPFNDHRLVGILDFFAERDGDVEARIALRAKNLSSTWAYLKLAEFCRTQGRDADALRWAEEGLWRFEDARPDERLVDLAVELLTKTGRTNEAEAHLWRAFEKSPTEQLYRKLRAVGGEAGSKRAEAFLRARTEKEKATKWSLPADLLIRVLMIEEAYDSAWETVRRHGASIELNESLARESEATHPAEALGVYRERVDQLASLGGDRQYAEAAALVARMGRLRSAAAQTAYVADLRVRFGRRRNFTKLLA